MILPEISLTFLDSIASMPFHMHSVAIHFLVTLPIVILILEIANMGFKNRVINSINIGLISLLFVALLSAYLTGIVDLKNIAMKPEILNAVSEHKVVGVYILIFGILFISIFKAIALIANKSLYSILYILMIILFIFMLAIESKSGSELVNKYGINVTKVSELETKQLELNKTIVAQNIKILDMNKTITTMKLKELNATNTTNKHTYHLSIENKRTPLHHSSLIKPKLL